MIEPVGPLSKRVYWIRRASVLAIALVVVLLLVWIVASRNSSATPSTAADVHPTTAKLTGELATTSPNLTGVLFPDYTPAASTADSSASSDTSATSSAVMDPAASDAAVPMTTSESAVTVAETPTADAAAQESAASQAAADAAAQAAAQTAAQAAADAAATQAAQAAAEAAAAEAAAQAAAAQAAAEAATRDDQGRLICPDASLQLTATVGAPTYNVGQQPIVGVTVVNVGSEACVRDLSGSLQEYQAYDAAGNRIWSTSDCVPGTGTDVRFMQPGDSLQYNIKWSGRTSQPGCAGERTTVPAGTYEIEVHLGSLISSRQQLTFQ